MALSLFSAAPTLRIGAAPLAQSRVAAPTMHTNIFPTFTILDEAKAKPLMEKCVENTKGEAGCIYYGWTTTEIDGKKKLFCRETYVDGAAVATHLGLAGPVVGEMIEIGAVALDEIGIMGTEADLAACKEAGDGLGCGYWKVWDSFENMKKVDGENADTSKFLTIQPTFTINDMAKAEPFMKKCVDLTKTEDGCMFYGWTIKDDKLFCREAYVNGKAVAAHIDNVVGAVGEMLESGAASLDKIELHGPASEWPDCKEQCDSLGMVYWDTAGTFSKFRMP